MSPAVFLSDEWIEAVNELKRAASANAVVAPGVVINATITDVPFGDGTIEVHSDTGPTIGWVPGHAPGADLSITIEYQMARALVIDETAGSFDLLGQELASGALQVDGDLGVLGEWWPRRIANPELLALEATIRSITL